MNDVIWIASDRLIKLDGLTGVAPDGTVTVLNAATVTWSLLDSRLNPVLRGNGTPVGGTLAYVAASAGNYAGEFDAADTALLTRNAAYFVKADIVQGQFKDTRWLSCKAAFRGAT